MLGDNIMETKIDNKERIARSNIYVIFGKFLSKQINNNDDGEVILKKSGLSSFVDNYKNRLNPYCYNGVYRNDNESYNRSRRNGWTYKSRNSYCKYAKR